MKQSSAILVLFVGCLFLNACTGRSGEMRETRVETEKKRLPGSSQFRKLILKILRSYPTDGSHEFYWPRNGGWKGTTRDLTYQGKVIAEGDPRGRCYCSGLMFELFFRAYREWSKNQNRPFSIAGMSPEELERFRYLWYGSDGNKRTIVHAVESMNVGREIKDLEQARPGDFVQFWRKNESGHSAVFLSWLRSKDGEIQGLRYWSSQGSTDGIDYNEETVKGEDGIVLDKVYVARIGR